MKVIPTKDYPNAFHQLSEEEINLDILEPLDFVKLRNGNILFVSYNLHDEAYRKGLFSPNNYGCKNYFCRYNPDLTHTTDSEQDIVGLIRCDKSYTFLYNMFKTNDENLNHEIKQYATWKEINTEEIKEMTIEEIEKELGYKIKIVKE